jgi:CRISPR-associated protein Csm2
MPNQPDQRHGNPPRQPNRPGGYDHRDRDQPTIDTSHVIFQPLNQPLNVDLFNGTAKQAAATIAENRNFNKPSQIRKFYDELCLWETKANLDPNRFADYLPFILMLNAKVAYAKGRRLVDSNFVKLLGDCLKQVKDLNTLRTCKLFLEAFLGFYKELRPSDK